MTTIERATLVPADITFGSTTVLPDGDGNYTPPVSVPAVPRFDVIREIGRGGVGSVVAATDRDIGRRVAIKRMLSQHTRSESAVMRFVDEVRTVGQLDHPNIVPLHDVGRDPQGDYFFVMKLLEGETLEAIIGRLRSGDREAHQRWTFARRTELFTQILHAMRFAHDQGFVHRDIKPANIMVGTHGEVHVVDWGVAKRVGAPELRSGEVSGPESVSVTKTRAGALIGTPRYMAPEQTRGEPADARTDTWQLSLLLYELLTLHHYLDGEDTLEGVLDGVRERPITHPRHLPRSPHQMSVPADLAWYTMAGLEREPAKRFVDAGGMLARLEARADGFIPVDCPVTAQKWFLNTVTRTLDRYPRFTTALVLSLLTFSVGSLAVGVGGVVIGGGLGVLGVLL